ncbi:MAG: hypothetical protein SFV54_01785 [Bryobacteraceae bacterium]|nr:hypothetical protein [Bryobacteraceae bacterium]
MKRLLCLLVVSCTVVAAADDHPTGPRITPPTVASVQPAGVARGTTVEMTVEGFNLAKASAVYFSEPGLTGRIIRVKELPDLPDIRLGANGTPSTVDVGPLPPRNQVTIEVDIPADAHIGPVGLRLLTPLGTSPEGRFLIEPYYGESPDREPNDTTEGAFECYLPTILTGTIQRAGDLDHFRIEVKAGEELVFENGAALIGSQLTPVISIVAPDQSVVREWGMQPGQGPAWFVHKFDKAGTYFVRVADYQKTGRGGNFYRVKVGRFPVVQAAYPLGLREGHSREVTLRGYNLAETRLPGKGARSDRDPSAVFLRPSRSFNELKLALGAEPEVDASGANVTLSTAQRIAAPVTVNGRIDAKGHYYRFAAKKGQRLVMEVNAKRLGSELDSLVEVLDAAGKPVERAVARAVWDTFTVLNERDSTNRGIRIQAWNALAVGDYVMIGGEILRLQEIPKTPDDDAIFEAFGGQRLTYFDTSAEQHAVDKPVYKVQIHPAGSQFANNGLPQVRLYYRNDDGGPGFGKDSLLRFTAPADGDYILRLRDVRGAGGDAYPYRLTLREPTPDFRLSVNPRNPNVPAGGVVPVTVTAFRLDDFDGPIRVKLANLPAGLSATDGVIAPGQVSTTILLSAAETASLASAAPLKVEGRAEIAGREVARWANPEDHLKLIATMPKADVIMMAETKEVVLEAGGTAEIAVRIERRNGFGGRVPVEVRNLPPTVRVLDVGLNGVLLNEDETRRTFTLAALETAEPIEQTIYVSGQIETRSPQQNSFAASDGIRVVVKPKRQLSKSE